MSSYDSNSPCGFFGLCGRGGGPSGANLGALLPGTLVSNTSYVVNDLNTNWVVTKSFNGSLFTLQYTQDYYDLQNDGYYLCGVPGEGGALECEMCTCVFFFCNFAWFAVFWCVTLNIIIFFFFFFFFFFFYFPPFPWGSEDDCLRFCDPVCGDNCWGTTADDCQKRTFASFWFFFFFDVFFFVF